MNQNEEPTTASKPKKHRVGRIITAVILCAILVVGSTAVYIYREEIAAVAKFVSNNLSTAFYALTTPQDVIQQDKENNDKKNQELLEEIAVATMRDLTDEERAMLLDGIISKEEALALIRGETIAPRETTDAPEPVVTTAVPDVTETTEASEVAVVSTPSETTMATAATTTMVTAVTTAVTTTAATETAEVIDTAALKARQEEIIAEIYLLRATYLNEIDLLIEETKKDYYALPKAKQTLEGKLEVVNKMIPKGNKLEAECDEKMESILAELSAILTELGESTDIITEIENTYIEQKRLKKTELYDQYSSKLK